MQGGGGRGRGGRNPFFEFRDPFAGFSANPFFEFHESFAGFLGGRSPFDDPIFSSPFGGGSLFSDPFFTRPFGQGMLGSSSFGPMGNPPIGMRPSEFIGHQGAPEPRQLRGPIIEEINSEDEKEVAGNERKENPRKHRRSSNGAYVEDPDDVAEEKKSRHLVQGSDCNRFNNRHLQPETRSFTFQSSSVTYGGPNGAYYTSSKTRRTGTDGVSFEESKEADSTSGRATHQVSRGLHNKGHSVTRKLDSDGKVDTMQTLHNLNEDELPGFEQAWKGTAQQHLPGWAGDFSGHENARASSSGHDGRGGWALPSTEPSHDGRVKVGSSRSHHSGRMMKPANTRDGNDYPRGRASG